MGNRTYPNLGAVKPHVRSVALLLGNLRDVETIHGIGARTGVSDHPLGLALDFMVYKDQVKGNKIVSDLKSNWKSAGVKYIIWQQAIDEGNGLEPMEDRGDDTANHRDHVHVSFHATPGDSTQYNGETGGWLNDWIPGYQAGEDGTPVAANPWDVLFTAELWWRVAMFVVGAIIIAILIREWVSNG